MEQPKISIKVVTNSGMEQDVTKYMENKYKPTGYAPDGSLLFKPPPYEMDGEDGFVPDMIDEGRDTSGKAPKMYDLFNEEHLVKVYVLSPFLFGKMFHPDSWMKYLFEVGLLGTCNPTCQDALSQKELDVVEGIETILEVIHADTKENHVRKKQMRELFEAIDKSVFGHDDSHLKLKPLTELLDRSRKFAFLDSWQKTFKQKKGGEHSYDFDDRALSVALIFCCRQFVEHWDKTQKGEFVMEKFKSCAKKKDRKIEDVKEIGNHYFKQGLFQKASEFYTKAIRESPFNAILYGNRAQSCLNSASYQSALSDGKRAIVLNPGWHKGYYRYAEAYFRLKQKEKAFAVIELGLEFCPNDKNLLDQKEKFRDLAKYNNNRMFAPNNEEQRQKPSDHQVTESDESDGLEDSDIESSASDMMPDLTSDSDVHSDASSLPGLVTESETSESDNDEYANHKAKINLGKMSILHQAKSETTKKSKKISKPWQRTSSRTDSERSSESQEKNSTFTKMQEKDDRHTEIFRLLKQGSESLLDNRCMNAIYFYNKCLDLINKYKMENITRFVELDLVLLKYSLGISCIEIGSTKEINEGMQLLNEILNEHTSVKFALVFHGLGRGWLKQFRFVECLKTVEKGLEVVLNISQQITYTWPGTTVVIKESVNGTLQENLTQMAIQCRNPPTPNAVCRYYKCHGYYSNKIYVKDPEFKGFVRIHCFAKCIVEYHVECWRRFKKERLSQSDKDYLNINCLTPDCPSRISKIHVFDQLGASLKELITPDLRDTGVVKPKVPRQKMKLCSATKIAKHEAKKQQRKQRKKELKESEAPANQDEETVTEGQGHTIMENTQELLDHSGQSEKAVGVELIDKLALAYAYQKEEVDEGCVAKVGMEKYMTVLNRREDEVEAQSRKTLDTKASSKSRSKKKQKSKVTMTLDEFVGPRETNEDAQTPVYMDCMDEISPDSAPLDPENPFFQPTRGSVKQELDVFEGLCTETSSVASSGSQPDNKHSQIRDTLFSFFGGILSEHGPLDKDDVIIKRELEDFPAEAHEVIDSAGGIDKLLLQSLHFAVVENFVCLLQDSMRARQLADLHRNPLKRSSSPLTPIHGHVTSQLKKMEFPSLRDSLSKVTVEISNSGTKLDELDIFTTTAGNLDSPVTSPKGLDSKPQSLLTDCSLGHKPDNGVFGSTSFTSASVTVSRSNVSTIVHTVESPSSKAVVKGDSYGEITKNTEGGKGMNNMNNLSKVNALSKFDTSETLNGNPRTESEVTNSMKEGDNISKSQKNQEPVDFVKQKSSSKGLEKPANLKGENKKMAANLPFNTNTDDVLPERPSSIKDSFKKQVHAVAGKRLESDVNKSTSEKQEGKGDQVKDITTEETKSVKKETQNIKHVNNEAKLITRNEKSMKKLASKEKKTPQAKLTIKDKSQMQDKVEAWCEGIAYTESNGVIDSGISETSQPEPFSKGQILRSCDDVSPVNSDQFTFPTLLESGQSSQSSMHSFDHTWTATNLVTGMKSDLGPDNKVSEIWDGTTVSLSETKFHDSGPWKSRLQEWKAPSDEGYRGLDKISDDSEFMTESRTSDKDLGPTKDAGIISKPTKFSKPPGFGGKAYNSNPLSLDNSANGTSKFGPIGSKSRTDSPASGSSKESSKTSTPIHGPQPDTLESQLPPFPSVHTGDSFLHGHSVVNTVLPMKNQYNNGLFVNNRVWPALSPPPSFNANLPPCSAPIGYPMNSDPVDRTMQNPVKQSDEQFIHETTDYVYESLCNNEAFKNNPLLKQTIEADIRADIERSKSLPHPSMMVESSLKSVNAIIESKAVKPVIKTRNNASQCTPQDHMTSIACNTDPYEPYKAEYLNTQAELELTRQRQQELMDKHTQLQNSSSAELKNLRSLVDALEQECKGLKRERTRAIEERDAENKKWQGEKRLIGEEMKNMKKEVKGAKFKEETAVRVMQEKEQLVNSLRAQLNMERDTIVSEREKFESDREELHRLHSMQLSRAETAEVNLLQLKVEVGTQILDRSLKDAEMYANQAQQILQNLKETKQPAPQQLLTAAEQWRSTTKTIKDTKQESMAQFEEMIHQIRQGTPLSALPQVPIPRPPPPPENPMAVMNAFLRNNPGGISARGASKVPPGAIPTNRPPNVRMPTTVGASQKAVAQGVGVFTGPPPLGAAGKRSQHTPHTSLHKSKSAFDKIMDKLTSLFPNLARSDITVFIQDLRSSRNGSLSGMSLDEIVRRVAEMILKENARRANKQSSIIQEPSVSSSTTSDEIFEEEEDPCIICHDELNAAATVHLECCHRFHTECIKKWFKEQSTCPTCRIHALLPDDFPTLG